ncbi:phosphatase 2C-like domain-containing protein [Mycena filopes]|nr:phosphatase 2C-like domain-containing protein [Mycena filopes]
MLRWTVDRIFSSTTKNDQPLTTLSACMLSALYEDDVRLLHVVSLGNMRAVLGRPRKPDGDGVVKYDVHVLSVDHSPDNAAERARIEEMHPGEDVIQNGTLLGRHYTRALGAGPLKWAPEVQEKVRTSHPEAAPGPRGDTPPYISAEPDVNTIKVRPGDFLVMSSHWVSEFLTAAEVVGLVGAWVNKYRETHLLGIEPPPEARPDLNKPHELPVDFKEGEDKTVKYGFLTLRSPTTLVAYKTLDRANTETWEAHRFVEVLVVVFGAATHQPGHVLVGEIALGGLDCSSPVERLPNVFLTRIFSAVLKSKDERRTLSSSEPSPSNRL